MLKQRPATANPDVVECGDVFTPTVCNNKQRCQGYLLSMAVEALSYMQNIRQTGFLCSLKQLCFVLHLMVLQQSRREPTGFTHSFAEQANVTWWRVTWSCFNHMVNFGKYFNLLDRPCGLGIRVPGCRPRGPGFDSRRSQIFRLAMGLERGPLSPCEDKWGATWNKGSGSGLGNWV
jgi:hypothetical protein